MKSYLSDRTQCVQINKVKSTFQQIEMGVPQGSILGPLLFILYVNDFPFVGKHITTYLYADDTAIFIEGNTEEELQNSLNAVLPNVTEWFKANQLSLNAEKNVLSDIYNEKEKSGSITSTCWCGYQTSQNC